MKWATVFGIFAVVAVLIPLNFSGANANSEDYIIPARARKAGASFKPKFLESITADNSHTASDDEDQPLKPEDGDNGEPQEELSDDDTKDVEPENDNNNEYYESYSEEGSVEKECGEDEFWHVRGLRCVPYHCPGGNSKRDKDTGECLYLTYNRKFRVGTRGTYVARSGSTNTKSRLTFRIFRG